MAEGARADDVAKFYNLLAGDYDVTAGYTDPVAEELRAPIKMLFREFARGRDVLEIACGTGYWTEVIASTARTVVATDLSAAMVAIARKRLASCANIRCEVADAYSLDSVTGKFNAGFAHWWWSHVPRPMIPVFLEALHGRLESGASVLFGDHLPGGWGDQRQDADGNTLDERTLKDGRSFEIVKNFPTCEEISGLLADLAIDIEYTTHPDVKMWTVSYSVRK